MVRKTLDGGTTPLTTPNHAKTKASTLERPAPKQASEGRDFWKHTSRREKLPGATASDASQARKPNPGGRRTLEAGQPRSAPAPRSLPPQFARSLPQWYDRAEAPPSTKVDLVTLNTAPIELQYAAVVEGRRFYECSPAVRQKCEAKVLGRYGDILPMLRQQRRDLIRGIGIGDGVQRYREALEQTPRLLTETRSHSQSSD